MAGRYGTTKADWWNDFSNNMATSIQDAMRMMLQKTLQQKATDQEMGLREKLPAVPGGMALRACSAPAI